MAVHILGRELVNSCKNGSEVEVESLLDQGVAVDSRDCEWTGLMWALVRGRREVVVLLLDRGASVNVVTIGGFSPLMGAVTQSGFLDVVELLCNSGANVNYADANGGSSALLWAAERDNLPVCVFLVSKGADLMATTKKGDTPLTHYGHWVHPRLSPTTMALRCAALEAAWAAGPHPSQVQRRGDESWLRRGPLLWVLAEHAYRPLQHRLLTIALAAALSEPATPLKQPTVALTTQQQRHAFLLGRVFSIEGIVRLMAALL